MDKKSWKAKQAAFWFAKHHHGKQKDRTGKRYVDHCIRVAQTFRHESEFVGVVAFLHDTLEDTDATPEEIEQLFGADVLEVVQRLTRAKGEAYGDYIQRVKECPIATKVKIADLKDNMDMTRLKEIGDSDIERLRKYHAAYWELVG